MSWAQLEALVKLLERDEDMPHFRDCVDAEVRAGAVRGDAVCLELEAHEAAVRNGELQIRGLGHDRGIGVNALEHGLGPDRGELLVGDGGDDYITAQAPQAGSGMQDRGKCAFHVVCTTPVQAPLLDMRCMRRCHPRHADGVEMRVQQQRTAPTGAGPRRDDTWPLVPDQLDLEPTSVAPVRHKQRNVALAVRARHERRVDGVDLDELCRQLGQLIHALRR